MTTKLAKWASGLDQIVKSRLSDDLTGKIPSISGGIDLRLAPIWRLLGKCRFNTEFYRACCLMAGRVTPVPEIM